MTTYAYDKDGVQKLNISDGPHTAGAVAALGKGFRGNKVEIPEADLPAVKKKVKAAYKKFFPDNEVPDILKSTDDVELPDGLLGKFMDFLQKNFGGSTQADNKAVVEVQKSLDEEKRLALFVVLEPEVEDAQGDIIDTEEVELACNNFNTMCMKANLFHRIETEHARIVQSFITPASFELEDGRIVKAGSWCQWWHFPIEDETSDQLWNMVKDGTINGVSIGCVGVREEIDA